MERVTGTIYNRGIQWAGGFTEKGDGFEVWRRMHKEYHGSGDSIMLSRLKLLREYPRHDKVEGLAAHLDGWEMLDEWNRFEDPFTAYAPIYACGHDPDQLRG